jgi:queuine tRNA-ribosyltransferase
VAAGVDMFDCVLPTRLARHGTVLTDGGKVRLRNAVHAGDDGPLDPGCDCPVCDRWSRGYLRHLLQVGEPTAPRLLTLHNLSWMLGFVERIRGAVTSRQLDRFAVEVARTWG